MLRDPGTTDLGEELRRILLDPNRKACPDAIFFGFLAARAELLACAQLYLDHGKTVIMDRLWPSTLAYQGYGSGIPIDMILSTAKYLLEKYIPVNIGIHYAFLTAPRETRRARLAGAGDRGKDRFESKSEAFFDLLDIGYVKAADAAYDLTKHFATVDIVQVGHLNPGGAVEAILEGFPECWVTTRNSGPQGAPQQNQDYMTSKVIKP